ncbi:leucine-rich repeat-containing G-protein coupled receptor 5-like [Monomorium pharaonis]|uniref:leucine-rich repeat-containing G-protein coupled receptor 5-like n=1 Tax=Monomorium pharaonis TaxID=307658 RepID=UPI0017472323|nr:leucine-rich repeat-containing G-protein coupled receptor 5-like [Monomorium pharaonis]
MSLAIVKFVFTIVIFVYWTTLSIADVPLTIEDYVNESLQLQCKDEISLNFSNAVISKINQDFISSPIITCLNLIGNNIMNIGKGAFNKVPNLTHLFLSNNKLDELFNFGTHDKLQVLIINEARNIDINFGISLSDYCLYRYSKTIHIFGEYPNLEILSLRLNCISELQFSPLMEQETSHFEKHYDIISKVLFPKLKILDLSENTIKRTNFINLISNNLYFLDLHNNLIDSLNLYEKGNNLFALNLNNNNFNSISHQNNPCLSMVGLKNLHYLSVFNNKVKVIDSNAFQDNGKLLYLNLSSNYINYIYPDTFANLQYLKTLDLSINELENVPQISKEIELNSLYINYNNITKLFSHSFVQMPKLTTLLLGQNNIDEIDVNAFADLSNLEELDLSKNMLRFLPQNWADSLVSIKYLDLSSNYFISLEHLSLSNASPLTEVYLTMNPLEYLNVAYFKNLPQNLTINLIDKSKFAKYYKYKFQKI